MTYMFCCCCCWPLRLLCSFHEELKVLSKMNIFNVIIGVLFCFKTKTGPSYNMSWMRYPGCSTHQNFFVDALPRQLHFTHLMKQNICKTTSWHEPPWNHDIWMKSSAYLTTLSSLNQDASGEGNSREIFQILNPKLQIIKVACNFSTLEIFIFKSCNLECIFFTLISKPSLHLGSLTVVHNLWVWYLDSIST